MEFKSEEITKKNKFRKHSAWYILVNTNVLSTAPEAKEVEAKLRAAIEEFKEIVRTAGETGPEFIRLNYEKVPDNKWNSDFIKEVEIIHSIETQGNKQDKVHANILLHITHVTYLHTNAVGIKEFFQKRLGIGTFVTTRLYRNKSAINFANLRNYFGKYIN